MLLMTPSLCVAAANLRSRLYSPVRASTERIIAPEHPWEASGVYHQGSVLKDDNWSRPFRMWYSAIGEKRREQQYLGYAESDDGVHFDKPLREQWGFGAWSRTNVLYGRQFNISAPNVHFYHRPREGYRYFLSFDSRIEQHENQFVSRITSYSRPGDRDRLKRSPFYTPDYDWNKHFPNPDTFRAVYLADSPDGLAWEPQDARFAIAGQTDGDHTVAYDPKAGLYRMYYRDNRLDENGLRVRQVVTATSSDTIEWSQPKLCLESDVIDDPQVHQIHGMCVTYRDGVFIGLIQVMEIEHDWSTPEGWGLLPKEYAKFHVQLAVSTDGERFERVGDRAVFFDVSPDENAFDHGMVRCGGQWVIDGDRMLMYYDGRPYAHMPSKIVDGKRVSLGGGTTTAVGIGVAQSPLGRFAGVTPADQSRPGHAVVEIPPDAAGITLNCDVPKGASVTAALVYFDSSGVRGFGDAQCVPIREGGLRVPLSWSSGARPRDPRVRYLRLCLTADATVYAVNFK